MDCSRCEGIQEPVNHMPSKYAPKPREPAASEETSTPAVGVLPGKSQKLTPCQSTRNWCPHCKSRWNSLLRRIGWSFLRKQPSRSIMWRKKVRPGHTTFVAWWRWPIRDSSSRLLHQDRANHEAINSRRAWSFSSGRWATWLTESSSMPRTVSTGAGPTHFPGWRGKPNRSQTAKAVLRFLAHWVDAGGPAVMKSSR